MGVSAKIAGRERRGAQGHDEGRGRHALCPALLRWGGMEDTSPCTVPTRRLGHCEGGPRTVHALTVYEMTCRDGAKEIPRVPRNLIYIASSVEDLPSLRFSSSNGAMR